MKNEEDLGEFDGYASEQEQEAERLIASLPDSREEPSESNLPRGVSITDIPGNSLQDEHFARKLEECFELLDSCKEMIDEFVIDDFPEEFDFVLTTWMKTNNITLVIT